MNFKEFLINFIFTKHCALCDKLLPFDYEHHLCEDCAQKPLIISEPTCEKCGMPIGYRGICKSCSRTNHKYDKAYALYIYKDDVRQSIHRYKYKGIHRLRYFYGDNMAEYAKIKNIPKVDYVVAVPVHWYRLLMRGYNQSSLLAKYYCSITGDTFCGDIIKRKAGTKPQSRLKPDERFKNIKNAFVINQKSKADIKGKSILLIDDIHTTGATADECARTLKKAGAKAVYVFCIAITDYDK